MSTSAACSLHSDRQPARFASFVAREYAPPATQVGRELLQSAKRAPVNSVGRRPPALEKLTPRE
jgi:hypothetical protein